MRQPSRIEQARRRLATTRLVVGAGSVVAFAALALVARAAHPGTSKAAATSGAATRAARSDDGRRNQFDPFFGNGSISSSSPGDDGSSRTPSSGS
jgi:hypothetical protein